MTTMVRVSNGPPRQPLEIGTQLDGILITQLAIFLERLVDDVTESVRNDPRQNRRAVQNRIEYDTGRRTAERVLAGGHFVEHDAEREKV